MTKTEFCRTSNLNSSPDMHLVCRLRSRLEEIPVAPKFHLFGANVAK